MKKLRETWMICTKAGPSGDFHYVLLNNPNMGIEDMRRKGIVSDKIYGRFIDRLMEIGAYADVEVIREYWKEQEAAAAKDLEQLVTG